MKALLILIGLSLAAFGAPADYAVPAKEIRSVKATAVEWQHKLQIEEFHITVVVVPLAVLETINPTPCLAASTWDIEDREGMIFILRRADYTKEFMKRSGVHKSPKADQRDSVLHEMMHLIVEHMATEAAVVTITTALKP